MWVILEIGKNVFELRIKCLMVAVGDVKLITDVVDSVLEVGTVFAELKNLVCESVVGFLLFVETRLFVVGIDGLFLLAWWFDDDFLLGLSATGRSCWSLWCRFCFQLAGSGSFLGGHDERK